MVKRPPTLEQPDKQGGDGYKVGVKETSQTEGMRAAEPTWSGISEEQQMVPMHVKKLK